MKKKISNFVSKHPKMFSLLAGISTIFAFSGTSFAAGDITMPAAPDVDLSEPLQWFFDFAVSIFTSNVGIIITVGIGIAAIFGGMSLAKKFGKSAVKG